MRAFLIVLAATATPVFAESIIVQSTTSTKNSGLYDHILPEFEAATGIIANIVAVGTGQAIRNAANCDADVLLVHAKEDEEQFVAIGGGLRRHDLMYNDFVIVGPPGDPAGTSGAANVVEAMVAIAESNSVFASRGDNSGTHKKEMGLWDIAGVDPTEDSGRWYRETGSGMGATLNAGIGMNAYVLVDRATWISFGNKLDHKVHVEGDDALFNQYGVILINPEACPTANVDAARQFVDWLLSTTGQAAIASYKVDGIQLFFPNAGQ